MPRKPTQADTKPLKVTERPTAPTDDLDPGLGVGNSHPAKRSFNAYGMPRRLKKTVAE